MKKKNQKAQKKPFVPNMKQGVAISKRDKFREQKENPEQTAKGQWLTDWAENK